MLSCGDLEQLGTRPHAKKTNHGEESLSGSERIWLWDQKSSTEITTPAAANILNNKSRHGPRKQAKKKCRTKSEPGAQQTKNGLSDGRLL
jgi:hypothetical protein